jgi:hypothetical protein
MCGNARIGFCLVRAGKLGYDPDNRTVADSSSEASNRNSSFHGHCFDFDHRDKDGK